MADDPYAAFPSAPTAGAADPYAAFKTVGGATPSKNDLSGDLLQRAMSTGTLGATDWAGAGINAIARATGYDPTAPTHAEIVAQNQRTAQEHPLLATAADMAGYAPLSLATGGLGTEAAVARAGLTGIPALMARGAAESALAGGGSQLIQDPTDPGAAVKSAVGGAALGGAVGGIGGKLVGGAVKAPAMGDAIATLTANKSAAIDAMNAIPADARQVSGIIDGVQQGLSPSERSGLTSDFRGQLQSISDEAAKGGNQTSVGDLNSWKRQLFNAATPGTPDMKAATRIGDQLVAISPNEQRAADLAHAQLSDAQSMVDQSPRQTAMGAAAKLDPDSGLLFSDAGKQAWQNLANTAPGPLTKGAEWLGTKGIGTAVGHTLGGFFGEGGLGGILGGIETKGGIPGAISQLPANMRINRARKALLATLAGNQLVTPGQIAGATPAWVPAAAQRYITAKEASSGS
jgi:hypothetical protein